MIKIICTDQPKENTKNEFYIDNSIGNSIAKKYNYAIENIILKQSDEICCFIHDDAKIINEITCENLLKKLYTENINLGIVGVIGCFILEKSCTWWQTMRGPDGPCTFGNIIQGYTDGHEQLMTDEKGTCFDATSIDGCCMFFPKRVFEMGLRFDEELKEYHFYDADICLQILSMGLDVGIADILIKHESEGTLPDNWNILKNTFFHKWHIKLNGEWPISRYSIRKHYGFIKK